MIKTIELMQGVTLRCFRDTRFKQGCLSFALVRPMDRAEAAMNALIPAVLLRGTTQYPDLRAITFRLDDLYGAAVGTQVRRVGDYHTVGLQCAFLEDRFALGGDRVLEPMVDFLGQLLFDSVTEKGGFADRYVESEKKNLIATIESELNNKGAYAMNRMLRSMCRADSFGIPRLGEAEDVAAIESGALYAHYRHILKTSPIRIFYVGSAEAEDVAALLKNMLRDLPREPMELPEQTPFRDDGGSETVERLDVAQGKLCLGYTTPITNRSREFPAMQVMNTLFGAGMTSKLFMNVREKLSLCYSIGSGYYGSKGILTVSAGIDFDKEELTRSEIARQLDAVRSGDITEEELSAAKEALLSSLRGTHDSPGSIEGFYSTAQLSGLGYDVAGYMDAIRAVTAEDVAAAAGTVKEHTSYFLKGVSA